MSVTLDQIDKGLQDIKKNMATKTEVIELIDKKIEEDYGKINNSHQEMQTAVKDIKDAHKTLDVQIRRMMSSNYASIKGSNNRYNGLFSSFEQAKNFGLFVLAATGNKKSKELLESRGFEVQDIFSEKAMTSSDNTSGGVSVFVEQIPDLIVLQEQYSKFRRYAMKWPMASDRSFVPKLISGLTVYCPGEGKEITESDMKLGLMSIVSKAWHTLSAISMQLNENSAIAIGEVIARQILWAMGRQEDLNGFLGDGTSTYFGDVGVCGALRRVDATIGNIKSLVVGSGNAYSELVLTDFEKLAGTVPDYADNAARWFVHKYFYYTVMIKLALAQGGSTAQEVIAGAGVREKTYLSSPVEFANVMPKAEANSQICALLGDLSQAAWIGTKGTIEIAQSEHRYFEKALLAIRGTQNVGFAVHGVGDTTNAGPICGLITAAS